MSFILSDRQIIADFKKTFPSSDDDLENAEDLEEIIKSVINELRDVSNKFDSINSHIAANTSYPNTAFAANSNLTSGVKRAFFGFAKILRERGGEVLSKIKQIKEKLQQYGNVEEVNILVTTVAEKEDLIILHLRKIFDLINNMNDDPEFLVKFKNISQKLSKEIFDFNNKILDFGILGYLKHNVKGEV